MVGLKFGYQLLIGVVGDARFKFVSLGAAFHSHGKPMQPVFFLC